MTLYFALALLSDIVDLLIEVENLLFLEVVQAIEHIDGISC